MSKGGGGLETSGGKMREEDTESKNIRCILEYVITRQVVQNFYQEIKGEFYCLEHLINWFFWFCLVRFTRTPQSDLLNPGTPERVYVWTDKV